MKNADKFKSVFGLYATELWSMPEEEFLRWLNSECTETEQGWIPCSERLPEPYEHCLWTTIDGRVVYHHCDGLFSNYTAWMPLPEAYREEGDS